MTRVIHTGDTHIGYQQYHSPARRDDFLAAFEQVVDDAVADDVDAVVHAGDLFHDRRPELQDLLGTLAALRRLDDAGVPFLAVVGNHESTRGGQWLDLYESLGLATRLDETPTYVGETAFYGLDWVPRSKRDALEYRFEPHEATYAALVSHGLFTPFAHADWETETVLSESTVDFDAMLLGDNHKADTAAVAGTWVTYCGSTERASASEEAGRGYNLVTFGETDDVAGDGGGAAVDVGEADAEDVDTDSPPTDLDAGTPPADVDIRRRALETRPFVNVSVDLGDGEGATRVREQVDQYELEDAVVVVEVTGGGEPVTPASIESFATERGALVARVTDRRELESGDDGDVQVSFADPDEAVRDRLSEMGLSSVAIDVDETVRASKVADSNVRKEVRSRVRDHVDEDLDAFAPAPDGGGSESESEHGADEPPARDATAGDDGAEVMPEPGPRTSGRSGATAEGAQESERDTSEEDDAEPPATGDGEPPATEDTESDDTQVSMEDYL